jgi:hypothetical protein
MDAQAGLDPCCSQTHYVGFVMTRLIYLFPQGTICKNDTDCGQGECCYIKPDMEVVSKKRQNTILPVPVKPGHHDTGIPG